MYRMKICLLIGCILIISAVSAQSMDDWMPNSGDWQVTQVQELNNCPDQFEEDLRWTFNDGDVLTLNFTSADEIPYQIHDFLGGEDVWNPGHFTVTAEDIEYIVYPNIMTQPYTYRYAVMEPDLIIMEYTQTLAMTNCELVISYQLHRIGDASSSAPAPSQENADLSNWWLGGDAVEIFSLPDMSRNDAICSIDYGNVDETWYFTADEAFVDAVRFGYGETLNYAIKLMDGGQPYDGVDIILVIGNGGNELHYTFDHALYGTYPTTEWQTYQVVLDEIAGWVDPEGAFDPSDPETFRTLLENTAQVWIRGGYIDSDNQACISQVFVGDPIPAVDDPTFAEGSLNSEAIGLLNGLYEITLLESANTCDTFFATGTIAQMQLSFNFSDDDTLLYLWTEGGEQPTVFYVYDADYPNFYQTQIENLGTLTAYSSTDFLFDKIFSDTCRASYQATWISN